MSGGVTDHLLVAQGGGPTAVINTSLYGVVRQAMQQPKIGNILGAKFGINGVLNDSLIDLRKQSASVIDALRRTPGSALGSCRHKVQGEEYERILDVLKRHDIRYFL